MCPHDLVYYDHYECDHTIPRYCVVSINSFETRDLVLTMFLVRLRATSRRGAKLVQNMRLNISGWDATAQRCMSSH
jgi:hypothetical protein